MAAAKKNAVPEWMNVPEVVKGRKAGSVNRATKALHAALSANIYQGKFTGTTLEAARKLPDCESVTENSLKYAARKWAEDNGWTDAKVTVRDGICKVTK